MDKKSKIILFLILGSVILLFGIVFYASYQIASIKTNYDNLAESVKNIKVINGINGKDGNDGKNGYGINGTNGKDSISTITKEIYYVQPPPQKGESGRDGKAGKDAEVQQIQINPETKDLETKMSGERYWTTLIPCAELLRTCPSVTVGIGNE